MQHIDLTHNIQTQHCTEAVPKIGDIQTFNGDTADITTGVGRRS